jgi:hypothetical protein
MLRGAIARLRRELAGTLDSLSGWSPDQSVDNRSGSARAFVHLHDDTPLQLAGSFALPGPWLSMSWVSAL